MDLKKEFENLVQFGLQSKKNKKELIQMSSALIASLNSIDKKELSKEELEKISAGINPRGVVGVKLREGVITREI
jgi:hypothetical protein